MIRVTARFPQARGADSNVMFAPVDLRGPLLAAGARECSQTTGTYVSGLPLRIDGVAKRLESGAPSYSQDIQRYQKPGSAKIINLLQLSEPYMESISQLFATFPAPGCPFPQTPVISSLGKMDALIKPEYGCGDDSYETPAAWRLRVAEFWIGCDVATPMIVFSAYTWGKKFTISASFDDSYYSSEFVFDVLRATISELGEGLSMGQAIYPEIEATGCFDASTQK